MRCGLVNLDKPAGVSSRRAVDVVKQLLRPAKTGHAGTLDPLASGVLVVCVGPATRLIEYVQRMPKRYTATFLLGRSSPTDDIEGEVTLLDAAPRPARGAIDEAAAALTGEIVQRPPAYSAIKVEGRRAYALARRGQAVDLAPRRVRVYRLEVVRYEYPELVLEIECGAGTYVRALGRDLAVWLGTAAVMSALVRTQVGDFRLDEAWQPERLSRDHLERWLLSPLKAVSRLPTLSLSAAKAAALWHGVAIERCVDAALGGEIAALGPDGALVAIVEPTAGGRLRPTRVLPG